MKTAFFIAGLAVVQVEGRGFCYMGGDPHVRAFDHPEGWTFHPVYSPGAWWLVNTESGDLQVQATYSQCGTYHPGKHHGGGGVSSPNCLESLAISSKVADHQAVAVQPPCSFNWGQGKCDDCTADKLPRVVFNGEKFKCEGVWKDIIPGVRVHCTSTRAQIKVGQGEEEVSVVLHYWGGAPWEKTSPKTCTGRTHASLHLWMNKTFGSQCGHCGDFDGDTSNDRIYTRNGGLDSSKIDLTTERAALCEPKVEDCRSLFLTSATPKKYNSAGHAIPDDESLCGCAKENACKAKGEDRTDVTKACAEAYKKVCKVDASPNKDKAFFEECLLDVCNGGIAFTEIDANDEPEVPCSESQLMRDHPVCSRCASA